MNHINFEKLINISEVSEIYINSKKLFRKLKENKFIQPNK